MTKDDAVKFFKTQSALGQAIGRSQPTISGWGVYPPHDCQYAIYRASQGQLPIEPDVLAIYGQPPELSAEAAQ